MTPESCTVDQPNHLTHAERAALTHLRNCYGDHRDVFTERELAGVMYSRSTGTASANVASTTR
jgi:hypothetical protein